MPQLGAASAHATVRAWAQVDLDAIEHNVRAIVRTLKYGAGLMAVVKANAYGHGAVPVARAALGSGAQSLGVAHVAEGIELREAGVRAPILLLGPVAQEELVPGIEAGLTFSVSSEDEIAALAERTRASHQGQRRQRRTPVHLLVDTGMGRGGFAPEELWPAAERTRAERTLDLEGVFTHFSSAEELDPAPTREQVALFRGLLRSLDERGVGFRTRHAANSAATVFFPEAQFSLVRCGALLHGLRPWSAGRDSLALIPALSLHTRIVHLGRRPAGWPVGYNRTHRCARESILATLSVGYRDGYPRELSGRGEVLIRGRRVPVAGMISMDFAVVDVTALEHSPAGLPEVGEDVTLIGASRDGGERISVEELAAASGTILYTITTQLGSTVERRYVGRAAQPGRAAGGSKSLEQAVRHGQPEELEARMELRRFQPPPPLPLSSAARKEEDPESPRRLAAGA